MVQSQTTSNPCSISQAAAVAALNGDQGFLPERNAVYQAAARPRGRPAEPGAGAALPPAGGRLLRLPELRRRDRPAHPGGRDSRPSEDFARYLLESAGVAVVHGAAFGLDPYFRISYATSTALLEEACRRIIRACEALD